MLRPSTRAPLTRAALVGLVLALTGCPSSPPDLTCPGGAVAGEVRDSAESCGHNGRGEKQEECYPPTWVAGPCHDPDACPDGVPQAKPAGLNGRGSEQRMCLGGEWGPWIWSDPDECIDDQVEERGCGYNREGKRTYECLRGRYAPSAPCVDGTECGEQPRCIPSDPERGLDVCREGDGGGPRCAHGEDVRATCEDGRWRCPPDDGTCAVEGSTRARSCPFGGDDVRIESCRDGEWHTEQRCSDRVCRDDRIRTLACGHNDRGVAEQRCVDGRWMGDEDIVCIDPDVCVDGDIRLDACEGEAGRRRLSRCVHGAWRAFEGCFYPDPCREHGDCAGACVCASGDETDGCSCAPVSCYDGLRNGDEQGPDCGGHCPWPCETCDGDDDDGDGSIDEDFELVQDCPPQGQCASERVCTGDGEGTVCQRFGRGDERCNGVDDDCDGVVDGDGDPGEDREVIRDCRDRLPGADTVECSAGRCRAIRCARGRTDPASGCRERVCSSRVVSEARRAGRALGEPCKVEISTPTAAGRAACRGLWRCAPDADSVVCTADGLDGRLVPLRDGSVSRADCPAEAIEGIAPETCNTIDDDLDGIVDEPPPALALGAPGSPCGGDDPMCRGTVECAGGRWVCVPATSGEQTCDPEGRDLDCDGRGPGEDVAASAWCQRQANVVAGHCAQTEGERFGCVMTCEPGWRDEDGDASNGCESIECGVDDPELHEVLESACAVPVDGYLCIGRPICVGEPPEIHCALPTADGDIATAWWFDWGDERAVLVALDELPDGFTCGDRGVYPADDGE